MREEVVCGRWWCVGGGGMWEVGGGASCAGTPRSCYLIVLDAYRSGEGALLNGKDRAKKKKGKKGITPGGQEGSTT